MLPYFPLKLTLAGIKHTHRTQWLTRHSAIPLRKHNQSQFAKPSIYYCEFAQNENRETVVRETENSTQSTKASAKHERSTNSNIPSSARTGHTRDHGGVFGVATTFIGRPRKLALYAQRIAASYHGISEHEFTLRSKFWSCSLWRLLLGLRVHIRSPGLLSSSLSIPRCRSRRERKFGEVQWHQRSHLTHKWRRREFKSQI